MSQHGIKMSGSLAKSTLVKVMIRTSIVVFALSTISYIHVYSVLQDGAVDSLDSYISQRSLRDRELFKLAEKNMEQFKHEFLRIWRDPRQFQPSERDMRRFIENRDENGFYRSMDRDFEYEASTFLDDDMQVTADSVRKILILEYLVPSLHAGWRNTFVNLYGVVREGAIVKHWPGRNYAREIPASMELNEQGWVTIGYPENNPERVSKWTGVFYDAPPKKYMTAVETPIYDGDQYLMNVGTDLLLDEIVKRNLNDRITGTYNVLFQEDGTIIAHPDLLNEIKASQGQLKIQETDKGELKEIFKLVLKKPDSSVIDIKKYNHFVAVGKYNEPGWYLVTIYPKSLLKDKAIGIALIILLIGLVSVLAEVVAMYMVVRRSVVKPVRDLMIATEKVAAGGANLDLDTDRNDELGRLGELFQHMARTVVDHRNNLELKVEDRTREIADRENSIQLMLDNAGSGFLTVDTNGFIQPQVSEITKRWFGGITEKTLLWDYLISKDDLLTKETMQFMFEELTTEPQFRNIYLEQLPKRFNLGTDIYSIKYKVITDENDNLTQVMVIVDNITGALKNELAEKEQKEIMCIFNRVIADPGLLVSFESEMKRLINLVTDAMNLKNYVLLGQVVHTIKGNTYTFGLDSLGDLCHQIEDELERNVELVNDKVGNLIKQWHYVSKKFDLYVRPKNNIDISPQELNDVLQRIESIHGDSTLIDTLSSWKREPAARRLDRLKATAMSLAKRMKIDNFTVNVESNSIRLPELDWQGFWGEVVHLIGNALTHGIESDAERLTNGKPSIATLQLDAKWDDSEEPAILIVVSDDGRGIDWDALYDKAKRMGVAVSDSNDGRQLLFSHGLSSINTVSNIAGRGFGMASVASCVERLSGTISVFSEKQKGTRFEIRIPIDPNIVGKSIEWSAA
ncbi:MAG: HPt (histidine-containing phosphotransfer) domain-containing protein/HAMP domain-containing protein [Cellvibrionaceae bacterium]|jgi:HPt (histidine-containing phosphotransfer) domain-containing protein/HAMP domain-containing protein/two-component sensor histidine kinase